MQIANDQNDPSIQQAKLRYGIAGNSQGLTSALERALKVAPIDLTVLVNGESGAGKEVFPKIIHANSPRKHARYIAVNCGAIPEGTIDSELFGHEKGAFTGAVASRKGYFEEADGGTVFLDEVAELPLTTQARLLRVLETGEYLKVGSSTVQKTNVRIVAATNVDLPKAVAAGKFREDLYYRLSTVGIFVPPLRERGNDILLLARKFASSFSEKYRTQGIAFDESAKRILLHYGWPGNVRQLKNVVEQVALFEAGKSIDSEIIARYLPANADVFMPVHAPAVDHSYQQERDMLFSMIFNLRQQIQELKEQVDGSKPASPVASNTALVKYTDFTDDSALDITPPEDAVESPDIAPLEETEKNSIKAALNLKNGRRKDAAELLGISERTLYRKIKEYGLDL